jgi:phosphate transport system permease protein
MLAAVWCPLPAAAVFAIWMAFHDSVLIALVTAHLPPDVRSLPEAQLGLVLNDMRNVIAGNLPASAVPPSTQAAAAEYIELRRIARLALTAVVFAIGAIGAFWVRGRIHRDLRARNSVERVLEWLLFAC